MIRMKRRDSNHSDPPVPWGKAYYNGTLHSIETILEQYAERQAAKKILEKYSYLPREGLLGILTVLGRLK
jgi:uncharacterized protein (DUF433 family)